MDYKDLKKTLIADIASKNSIKEVRAVLDSREFQELQKEIKLAVRQEELRVKAGQTPDLPKLKEMAFDLADLLELLTKKENK
jgi:hypothetical protein